ncbi:hypothetical protein K523DRAFT_116769 [Schizophyllum commune Tattone D]|nr:hypothetical protein K523DRAFT_116769 [Schizophyllum commune Tattone D]
MFMDLSAWALVHTLDIAPEKVQHPADDGGGSNDRREKRERSRGRAEHLALRRHHRMLCASLPPPSCSGSLRLTSSAHASCRRR